MSHARFQAISNAYAILSGKKISSSSTNTLDHDTPYHEEVLRRKRAQWRASAGSDEFGHSGPSLWERQEREKFDQAALVFVIVLVCDLFFSFGRMITSYLSVLFFFPLFGFLIRLWQQLYYRYQCYRRSSRVVNDMMKRRKIWLMQDGRRRTSLRFDDSLRFSGKIISISVKRKRGWRRMSDRLSFSLLLY